MTKAAVILLAAAVALGGCAAAPRYDKVNWATRVQHPEPGLALIYFVRDGRLIGDSAIVMDDDVYIGELPAWGHIAYLAKPGIHRFAVVSEAADFMEADLQAGKTYYANVRRRMGVTTERYSFVAHNDPASIDKARQSVDTTPQLCANDLGRERFEKRQARIQWTMHRYYKVWETNPTRQILSATAGR